MGRAFLWVGWIVLCGIGFTPLTAFGAAESGVGYCTDDLEHAKAAGFHYAELGVRNFATLSEADFRKLLARHEEVGLPTPVGFLFLAVEAQRKEETNIINTTAKAIAFLRAAMTSGVPKPRASAEFTCTQVIGVSVTGDWFGHGFEDGIDGNRWQVLWRSKAFVDLWADPASELWGLPLQSPCAERSENPDHVIFTGVNWEYKTREEWEEKLTAAVATIRAKYPGVRRIDLLTMLRGPGNQSCGSVMTVVQPYVDEAVASVVSRFPGLVFAGPQVETPTCDVFVKGGPHYTDAGMAAVAALYRTRLAGH